jgi:outer membrane cobalamin receptor
MRIHVRTLPVALLAAAALAALTSSPGLAAQEKAQEEKKRPPVVTEEIVVVAPMPEDRPLSTTSVLSPTLLEPLATRNLAEVLSFAPGSYVTSGGKGEARPKLRGLDNDKSTLLIDGVPVYEPYFNSYDLRTVLSDEVESVRVVKGASSVLYGPNTLGGIVEVLTRRPNPPSFTLRSGLSRDGSWVVSASGAAAWKKAVFLGSFTHDASDGTRVRSDGGTSVLPNSDYRKTGGTAKIYLYPGERSEILASANYFGSAYGIPWAREYYTPRYWRFKDWRRLSLGLGGTFPLFGSGTLKARTYYVRSDNTLDAYTDDTLSALQWESLYRNYSAGAFLLGSRELGGRHELRFSLNGRLDHVEQQGSATAPWEEYEHKTLSAGIEDEFRLTDEWRVSAGFSLDHIRKMEGQVKTTVNPVGGIRFVPSPSFGMHLAFSMKSRFPSMRSLYSATGGNPDLRDEVGRTFELGALYDKSFRAGLTGFVTKVEDLIYSIRLPDGTRTYINVGRTEVAGAEAELGKRFGRLDLALNATFLDTKNVDEDRPLDLVPRVQASLFAGLDLGRGFSAAFWTLATGRSQTVVSGETIIVDGAVVSGMSVEKSFGRFALYVKADNVFDAVYATEPGYPMASRRIEAGFRLRFVPARQAAR